MRALPLSIVWVSKERSSAVEVWAAVSELVQRTRPPFFTTTVTGMYLNDLMSTVADSTAAPPPPAGAVEAVLDCAVMSSLVPDDEEPHPASSTAARAIVSAAVGAGMSLLHSPPARRRISYPTM